MSRYKKIFTNFLIILSLTFFILPLDAYANESKDNFSVSNDKKTVAVLTSGGDSPGMNAVIRAFTKSAISMGMNVIGIRHGYEGLLHKDFIELNLENVSGISCLGGTILHSSRSKEFNTQEGVKKAAAICKEYGIAGIAVIGGDGSFRGARDLTNAGVSCIGIPGTIDNDIKCTDYTIGFDTAINTTIGLIDKVRDTSKSHDRCFVIEVMGMRCGDIALQTGLASEANVILVPEIKYDFQKDVIDRIKVAKSNGESHFIVIIGEGVGGVSKISKHFDIAENIESETGIDTRYLVFGHLQRGGAPTLKDRVLASEMGMYAAKLLNEGKENRVIAKKDGKIIDIDITEALKIDRPFNYKLYNEALTLGQ